jgi:hypothetical protein
MIEQRRGMIETYGMKRRYDFAFDNTGTDEEWLSEFYDEVRQTGALGHGSLFLPPVSSCRGRELMVISLGAINCVIYPFELQSVGGNKRDSVIWDGSGSANSFSLTGVGGWALLKSLGDRWILIASDADGS